MTPLPKNHVRLYNTLQDIETSVPYATEDAVELELVISRFVSFARMVAVNQNIAAQFADRSTDHIQLATDLRTAMKISREHHHYPNVVLPMSKYIAAKMLSELSKSVAKEPAFIEMMERENRLWAESSPYMGVLETVE
jgi:hypothetical protein